MRMNNSLGCSVASVFNSNGLAPLQSISTVVLDLDGVVYRGLTPIPGAQETILWLRQQGIRVLYLTNNSTLSRVDYVHRLGHFGIPCRKEDVYSSSYATALYIKSQKKSRPRVLIVGEGGLFAELRRAGAEVLRKPDGGPIDYVVVGMDRRLTYTKIAAAQHAIINGAQFVASNRDPVYPVEHGLIPGGGTVVAAIEVASQQKPVLIGKPSPYIMRLLLRNERVSPQQVLLIGDRLDTDIAGAVLCGWDSLLVLTGVSTRDDVTTSRVRPTFVADDLGALIADEEPPRL